MQKTAGLTNQRETCKRQPEKRQTRLPGNQKRDKQEAQAIRKETNKRPRQSEKRQAKGPEISKETFKGSGLSEKRQTTCPASQKRQANQKRDN